MYPGYLKYGNSTIINAARTKAYVEKFLPRIDVSKIETGTLKEVLGNGAYDSPAADNAAWWDEDLTSALDDFYGLLPAKIDGWGDGTRTINVTELPGDGAIQSRARYGSKELRYTALAIAKTDKALKAGLGWLRDRLEQDCGSGCSGHTATVYRSMPGTSDPADGRRTLYRVELLEGPKVVQEFPTTTAHAVLVEWTFSLGLPWMFTDMFEVGVLDMTTGYGAHDDGTENCSEQNGAYKDFINDPYFTAIAKPPAPPTMKPPNLLDINNWRRRTLDLPASRTKFWGRTMPHVYINAGTSADARQVRVRFYKKNSDLAGCDYEGEYLISYLPKNATLALDPVFKEAWVYLPGGSVVPGGHLLYGSDGRPFRWPDLGCKDEYTMTVDVQPSNPDVVVGLDLMMRE